MSDLQQRFEAATQAATNLSTRPTNETMLLLYALFKQAQTGDAGDKRPGAFDIVGRAKYDAWVALRGMPCEQAMQRYVELVEQLQG